MDVPLSNRAARRRAGQRSPRRHRAQQTIAVLGTAAVLGAGALVGPSGAAQAAGPFDSLGLGDLTGLLENELIQQYVEICQNPDGSTPIPVEGETPQAVADCSQSTGTGIAVVLPESVEVGAAAESIVIDLGDDISILGIGVFEMGERNLIEIVSAAAIDPWNLDWAGLPNLNPTKLGAYSTYEQVQADAALPVNTVTVATCTFLGITTDGECRKVGSITIGSPGTRSYDANLARRTEALQVAAYLTGETYDFTEPVALPGVVKPQGSSTVIGPGIQLALSMTGGIAQAETGHELSLATAGAGNGLTSSAYSLLGMANALNVDTDTIKLTWFGQELDFANLQDSGLLDLAGDEGQDMIDQIDGLQLPALKEVSCFGVYATATAEGLGSCTNILGTVDLYQDLREPVVGESRQTQYGLTDLTSLILGNDALAKQLGLFGTTPDETPFVDNLMANLTSEDGRLKFAKDFVRYTQDVRTELVLRPVLDDEGQPVLGDDGEPLMEEVEETVTAAWLTSDYGLREPITIDWLGQRIVLFPAVEINGTTRPNLIGAPQITRIVDDADAGLLPKISLIQWDNPFGLGAVSLDNPFDPIGTFQNWLQTVTLGDDLAELGDLVGGALSDADADDPASSDGVEPVELSAMRGSVDDTEPSSTDDPASQLTGADLDDKQVTGAQDDADPGDTGEPTAGTPDATSGDSTDGDVLPDAGPADSEGPAEAQPEPQADPADDSAVHDSDEAAPTEELTGAQ